ncbi:MAG: NAD-dependent deacetylase [Haloarculaceae archaeon]
MTRDVDRAADLLGASEHLVGFTGAGVSTESGIPDFRSPGGLWDRYDPSDFTIQALRRDPVAYWERRREMRAEREFDWSAVEPNPAHHALAALERDGPLEALVTQNVDGLHQAAGSERVLELHGTRTEAKCLECDRRVPIETLERKLEDEPLPPRCDACDGLLKRATVSFGEALPRQVLQSARQAAVDCDCFLVAGSSLTVQPAASLPRLALQNGADLVVVNLEATAMDDAAAVAVQGKAGEVLPRVVERALDVEVSRAGPDESWEPDA